MVGPPPSSDGKIKAGYVPRLAAAAMALARSGLIDVYEEYAGPGEPSLLLREEGVEAVGTLSNWWQDDAEDDRTIDGGSVIFYSVAITDEGREVLASYGGVVVPWPQASRPSDW